MCCRASSLKQRQAWAFGLGSAFAIFGIVLLVAYPKIVEDITSRKLVLQNGSEAYELWKETPIPLYLEFYLFNWTNPHDIRNTSIKPHFVQMGPYVYREKHIKENVTFNSNNTVSYYQRRVWHFDAERSNGTEEDMVTAAHPITATLADMMRHKNSATKKVINLILKSMGGKLYTTKSVHEWIFYGYHDQLLSFLKLFDIFVHIPYSRFGWMADRNNSVTYDGLFNINTGVNNMSSLGLLTHWNGETTSGFYPAPCGNINGTTGDLFPPHLDVHKKLTIFATDACRFLNLSPTENVVRYGVVGQQWEGTNQTLDSGENFNSNACFCNKDIVDECPKTGVTECKKCRNEAPIYISFPHFYLGDASYVNDVSGLNPQKELHKFSLAVEPTLGIPLEVHARLQINMLIQPDDIFEVYRGVPKILMPMFWFEQKAELSESLAARTRLALSMFTYGKYVGIILIVLGSFLAITTMVAVLMNRRRYLPTDDDDEEVLTTDAEPIYRDPTIGQ